MATPDEEILQRLTRVRAEVDLAATAAGRDPGDVRLLLATKTQPPDRIITALRAGITLIGENRVQEVVAKADELADVPHELHFIGHLQTNKINQLLGRISCLQTLDSVELAEKLQNRLETREARLDVLIQVNVSGEESKSGVAPVDASDLFVELARFPALTVRGFMTVGLNSTDREEVRSGYRRLAQLRDTVRQQGLAGGEHAVELSMGMSGDFADAIAEGATIVRLGSAVFGPRATRPTNPA
jgi:pyridoxal phosphate enzyme (YggS family)